MKPWFKLKKKKKKKNHQFEFSLSNWASCDLSIECLRKKMQNLNLIDCMASLAS
jgi:hypothetical protein